MNAKRAKVIALTMLLSSASGAVAQLPPPPINVVPNPNPSSSLVLPAPGEVPVSPTAPSTSLGSTGFWYGHRSFCSVFRRGPCFPRYLPPIGQDLRLTIVSNDDNDPTGKPAGDADTAAEDQTLDSIRQMYAALRACWVPPPKDKARHGMQYTIRFALKRDGEMIAPPRVTYASHDAPSAVRDVYRDAVDAALKRCTPLHFSDGMGGAVAGRPIAIRFVDDRTIDNQ
jgi:hypothetical protein